MEKRANEIVNWLSMAGERARREREEWEEAHKDRCEVCGALFLRSKGMVSPIHSFCPDHIWFNAREENGATTFVDIPILTENCYVCGNPLGIGTDGRPHCGYCNTDCEECLSPKAIALWKEEIRRIRMEIRDE